MATRSSGPFHLVSHLHLHFNQHPVAIQTINATLWPSKDQVKRTRPGSNEARVQSGDSYALGILIHTPSFSNKKEPRLTNSHKHYITIANAPAPQWPLPRSHLRFWRRGAARLELETQTVKWRNSVGRATKQAISGPRFLVYRWTTFGSQVKHLWVLLSCWTW